MYIIDKNNDFYDHYSHIYGIDKQIVFDRRGSALITNDLLTSFIRKDRYSYGKSIYFYLLEIGYKQYLIEITDVVFEYDKFLCNDKLVDYKIHLIQIFDEQKHLFEKELSLVNIHLHYSFIFKYHNKKKDYKKTYTLQDLKYNKDDIISLPILKNTFFTRVVNADIVWKDLSTYVSSQNNDKKVDIVNTDKDKISNHGFDDNSFRNPIKL